MSLPEPPLLLITDRARARPSLDAVVEQALAAGCRWISLREKDLGPASRRAHLSALLDQARGCATRITIMVHGDVAAALELGAGGVHLPAAADPAAARRRLGPHALVGQSSHTLAEAEAAERAGADYVTLSPVFPTPSKPGYGPPLGLDGLAQVARRLSIPVLALGGIDAASTSACLAAGAAGVAVMGAIMAAADPEAAAAAFVQALRRSASGV